MITVLLAASCFALPPLFTFLMRRAVRLPLAFPQFYAEWAFYAACGAAGTMLGEGWLFAAAYGTSGLVGLVLWWWSRRKRRKALRLLWGKAKARLAAMLRNMPRPSPRLVPQGARA
jgi:hypothetical protein